MATTSPVASVYPQQDFRTNLQHRWISEVIPCKSMDALAAVRRSSILGRPGPIPLTINQPGANAVVGRTFIVSGSTAPNASVNVTAGASQSAAAGQFNGNTTAGPRGNFQISVTLKALMGQQSVTVRITATDPSSSQTATTTLQLRFRAGASAANGSP
jgi:hypothetical protein